MEAAGKGGVAVGLVGCAAAGHVAADDGCCCGAGGCCSDAAVGCCGVRRSYRSCFVSVHGSSAPVYAAFSCADAASARPCGSRQLAAWSGDGDHRTLAVADACAHPVAANGNEAGRNRDRRASVGSSGWSCCSSVEHTIRTRFSI